MWRIHLQFHHSLSATRWVQMLEDHESTPQVSMILCKKGNICVEEHPSVLTHPCVYM